MTAALTALVERYRIGLRHMDRAELAHEAERDAALPRSPVADELRHQVDAEQEYRRAKQHAADTDPEPTEPDLPRLPRPKDPAPVLPSGPAYVNQITNALLALGRTSPEITANLARRGFVGRRWASNDCPVFRYLISLHLPVRSINPMLVNLIDGGRVLVPDAIGTWMAEYDGYAYPALVEVAA